MTTMVLFPAVTGLGLRLCLFPCPCPCPCPRPPLPLRPRPPLPLRLPLGTTDAVQGTKVGMATLGITVVGMGADRGSIITGIQVDIMADTDTTGQVIMVVTGTVTMVVTGTDTAMVTVLDTDTDTDTAMDTIIRAESNMLYMLTLHPCSQFMREGICSS